MDEFDAGDAVPLVGTDPELARMLGMFDVPAFARRGQDLEHSLRRLRRLCEQKQDELLEMVQMRLRQWTRVAVAESWTVVFAGPIEPLLRLAKFESPNWAPHQGTHRQQRAVAKDLIASVKRFNDRWLPFVDKLNLEPTNRVIDHYNRYYVLEKECVMGSAKLAARYFTPVPPYTRQDLLEEFPPLPLPELRQP